MPPTKYIFKTQPYQHQKDTLMHCWHKKHWALFCEMGTGKSKITIDNAGILFLQEKIDAMLIVAPKGCYNNWSTAELPLHLSDQIPTRVFTYRSGMNNARKEEFKYFTSPNRPMEGILKVLVVNIEGLANKVCFDAVLQFLKNHRTMMVVDESTSIKTPKSQRTKRVTALGKSALYRRILTGSPVTNTPLDLFAQARFLNEDIFGRSFTTFKSTYAEFDTRYNGNRRYEKYRRPIRLEELHQRLTTFATVLRKEDCLDLPAKVYQKWEVEMTDEQNRVYIAMRDEAIALLNEQEEMTASFAITQLLRLHQITCGFVKPDLGEPQPFASNPRIVELVRIIEGLNPEDKVIIWANYRFSLKEIIKTLDKLYGRGSTVGYYGDTADADREIAIRLFSEDPECRFFVANPATGGYGITLTCAHNVIYFSNSYSLEQRLQSEDRCHRIGQTKSCTYTDLVVPNTVDEKVINALRSKKEVSDIILSGGWKELFDVV